MATKILLTSPDFIKEISNISDNMQEKFIAPAIRESQDIDLQSVLGTKMLDKLTSLVSAGTIDNVENAIYKELLDTAQYYLAYDVIARLVVISAVHLDNMGPNQGSDEHNNVLNLNDSFKLEDYYNKKRDFYCKRLQDFCVAHRTELPELSQAQLGDMASNTYSAADTGVWLGGIRGGRPKNKYD